MRKTSIIVVASVLLAGSAAAAWWLNHQPHADSQRPAATQSSQASQANDGNQQGIQAIQTSLNSHDLATQAKVMSPELAAAYQATGQGMLPPGGSVRLLPETLRVEGNTARVDAVMTVSGASATYTFLLTRQGPTSPWQILTTEGK